MSNKQQQKTGNILIVDDTLENLQLLSIILKRRGYTVRLAESGQAALNHVQAALPDLILLDVMMVEMNGYEVCRRLKSDSRTQEIPVIFITALDDVGSKIEGFAAGGVDYITKPFETEEVMVRVNTHLSLRRTRQQLQGQIAELDAFAHTVAHDIKGPLGVISGYTDLLVDMLAPLVDEEILEHVAAIQRNTLKTANIVDELLLLASVNKTQVKLSPVDMGQVVDQAMQRLEPMIKEYQVEIHLPTAWPTALGYAPWLEEVWVNYLSNGLKYGGRPPRLTLGATPKSDDRLRFWVRDNGIGLTPEEQAALFTEFTRLNQIRVEGFGLGLSIVQRIMKKLNGQVGVESRVGLGSTFYFTLLAA